MQQKEFINLQVIKLKDGFSNDQIKREVYEYCVKHYLEDMNLNALIYLCMGVYAEINLRYSTRRQNVILTNLYKKGLNHHKT